MFGCESGLLPGARATRAGAVAASSRTAARAARRKQLGQCDRSERETSDHVVGEAVAPDPASTPRPTPSGNISTTAIPASTSVLRTRSDELRHRLLGCKRAAKIAVQQVAQPRRYWSIADRFEP